MNENQKVEQYNELKGGAPALNESAFKDSVSKPWDGKITFCDVAKFTVQVKGEV